MIVDKLFSETVAQDLDMWILGWSFGIFPNHLEAFFHSRYAPENQNGGNNWGGFADPEFDALADEFLQATTFPEARDLVHRMQELVATRLPYVTPVRDSQAGRLPPGPDRIPLHRGAGRQSSRPRGCRP